MNGNGKIWERIAIGAVGVLVTIGLAWTSSINGDVAVQGKEQAKVGEQVESIRRDLTRIETKQDIQFEKLDQKLDRLLDKKDAK